MITETYVSFEVAKLLKEKGFDGECMSMYITPKPHSGMGNPNEAKIAPHGRDSHYYDGYLYQCEAPTLQMAMDWLRVTYKHHIVAEPRLYNSANTDSDFSRWLWTIITEDSYLYSEGEDFPTYESAAEAALKHCLENLI